MVAFVYNSEMTEIFDDIRKIYIFQKPCFELEPCIDFFSETCAVSTAQYIDSEEFTVKMFPSFTPTIWMNLGTNYYLNDGEKNQQIDKQTDILVLRNTALERRNHFTDHIFTVKFRPTGFEAIFGFSQSKIGSNFVDIKQIMGQSFIQKIKQQNSFEDRIYLLEKFFLNKLLLNLSRNHEIDPISKAIEQFEYSNYTLNMSTLAERMSLSEKTFYRYFKHTIGTNPKNFFCIMRARKALTAYQIDKSAFSPYDFGYYDFGHFSKDVVRFTGNNLNHALS